MLGTVGIKEKHQCSCGATMPLSVLNTPAGYYLGYFCPHEGPYSRETDYMSEDEAKLLLQKVLEALNAHNN